MSSFGRRLIFTGIITLGITATFAVFWPYVWGGKPVCFGCFVDYIFLAAAGFGLGIGVTVSGVMIERWIMRRPKHE